MTFEVLNPTYEEANVAFETAPRLASLEGITLGVVSNGKQGTGRFFDAFSDQMRTFHGVGEVVRVVKPNYSAPAGDEIMDAAASWHALVAGIGD